MEAYDPGQETSRVPLMCEPRVIRASQKELTDEPSEESGEGAGEVLRLRLQAIALMMIGSKWWTRNTERPRG